MISVVYCTREKNPKHTEHIMRSSGLGKKIEVIEIINNGEALTKAYNRGLKMATNEIVVFMHDDIEIETSGWGNKIIKHFETNPEYGILGLAGTTDMPLSGRWWEDRTKMVGIVNHKHEGKKWESKYSRSLGNELAQVLIVDGLFFAVHKQRIKNTFDESVEGFHFYEITFVFSNHLKGVKVGVMFNIRVTHLSIGVTNEEWEKNRLKFVNKFNDDLPEKLVPDFYKLSEQKNTNTKININLIVQSTGDVETFKNFYDNVMSYNYPNLKITLMTTKDNYQELNELKLPSVRVFKGFYDSLPKNISVLNIFNNFISESDELIFIFNDNAKIVNNIFINAVKLYTSNKNNFGCIFPLSYSQDKTIFSSSLNLFMNKDNGVAIQMKDSGTYYNTCYGPITNPIGNLSDGIITTYNNLKSSGWLNSDYEVPLYFNEFSLKLSLKNKVTYNDTNSLIVQSSFGGQTNIQQDFQRFINFIGSNEKLKKYVKEIK